MSNDNARQGRLYRAFVAARLSRLLGRSVVARSAPYKRPKSVSDAIAAATQRESVSDLLGIDGWAVVTRHAHPMNVAGAVDAATVAARLDGAEYAAAVVARSGADPEQSYVVMTLDTWARVLDRLGAS